MTDLGIWGQWVNGGAWLTIKGQRVDFIYRDLDFMTATINDVMAATGRSRSDFWQQAPYGFHPADLLRRGPLHVPALGPGGHRRHCSGQKVAVYPEVMKRRAVSGWLWSAQFTAANAKHAPERGEAYLVAGFLTRAATEMIQALYALNETFYMNDKYVYRDIAEFMIVPQGLHGAHRRADVSATAARPTCVRRSTRRRSSTGR